MNDLFLRLLAFGTVMKIKSNGENTMDKNTVRKLNDVMEENGVSVYVDSEERKKFKLTCQLIKERLAEIFKRQKKVQMCPIYISGLLNVYWILRKERKPLPHVYQKPEDGRNLYLIIYMEKFGKEFDIDVTEYTETIDYQKGGVTL